jgi:hypothetical protein
VTIGVISALLGIVLLVGAVIDPRGYFTRGFNENPPGWWEWWLPNNSKAWRAYLALFGVACVTIGIVLAVW